MMLKLRKYKIIKAHSITKNRNRNRNNQNKNKYKNHYKNQYNNQNKIQQNLGEDPYQVEII